MSQFIHCHECGKPLPPSAKSCRCGWRKIEPEKIPVADHRCQYQIMGRRCPLPAGACPYPYGNGPWYCSGHRQTLDDPKQGEAVLIYAEENYDEILEGLCDWRRKLPHNNRLITTGTTKNDGA